MIFLKTLFSGTEIALKVSYSSYKGRKVVTDGSYEYCIFRGLFYNFDFLKTFLGKGQINKYLYMYTNT